MHEPALSLSSNIFRSERNMTGMAALLILALVALAAGQYPSSWPIPTSVATPVHDPSGIVKDNQGVFHLFATGDNILHFVFNASSATWAQREPIFDVIPFPAWVPEKLPAYTGRSVWAPDVIYLEREKEWVMVYSLSVFGKETSCIGMLATPTLANATWVDKGAVLCTPQEGGYYNAIDPHLLLVEDSLIMNFGSYWTGIYMYNISGQTMFHIAQHATHDTNEEASWIDYHNGYFYLYYNWGQCCMGVNSTYNVHVARSKYIEGPYEDKMGMPSLASGGTLLMQTNGRLIGPGQVGFYRSQAGDDVALMSYHFYDGDNSGTRSLGLATCSYANGWPNITQIFPAAN